MSIGYNFTLDNRRKRKLYQILMICETGYSVLNFLNSLKTESLKIFPFSKKY